MHADWRLTPLTANLLSAIMILEPIPGYRELLRVLRLMIKGVALMSVQLWRGTYAATLCPFKEDYRIDEDGLRTYVQYLAREHDMKGLVCNTLHGEVLSLQPGERARVTQIMAEEVGYRVRIVAGVCAESTPAAIDHALAAKEAGAHAILLMPLHNWLRTGRAKQDAFSYVAAVAANVDIPIIVDQYPAWTKACYSVDELITLFDIPQVVAIRMSLGRCFHDSEQIKKAAPRILILASHDGFLCESLLAGADGAIVALAGFVPELVVPLVNAVLQGDQVKTRSLQERVSALAKTLGLFDDSSSVPCQRLKTALTLQDRFPSVIVRPPLLPLSGQEVEHIRVGLTAYRSQIREELEQLPV